MDCYVILKDLTLLTIEETERIKDLELDTYEQRFPNDDSLIEVYKKGTINDCENFIASLEEDLKYLFETINE